MKQILIVDDVAADLESAVEVLKDSYDITARDSGKKALTFLQDMQPDLILLDVNMPDMNGYEVMEHMQKSPHLSKIPVILLTAAEQEEEERSIASGAVDLIRKPFDPQMLLNRIEAVWKREA